MAAKKGKKATAKTKKGSKRKATTKKRSVPKKKQQDRELEGGPLIRQREFFQERFAVLGPKAQQPVPRGRKSARAAPRSAEQPDTPPGENPLPADFRLRKLDEYRERQRAQAMPPVASRGTRSVGRAAGTETDDEDDRPPGRSTARSRMSSAETPGPERPAPPLPPPANNWVPIGPSVLRQG